MPIECSIEIVPIGQEQFHAIDTAVMGHVFDIHNAVGRFCDEQRANTVVDHAWAGDDNASRRLREVFSAWLANWGFFLDICLYREAMLHFLAASEAGIQPVDIRVDGRIVGTQ